MDIQIDTREKQRAIRKITGYFDQEGIRYFSSKLFAGDYMSLDNPRLIIDRKKDLLELCGNVCQQHKRFIQEIQRAREHGVRLVILCEHGGGIRKMEDVKGWYNYRRKVSPLALDGPRLYKILYAISTKYGVPFLFCEKKETGERIARILGGAEDV